MSSLLIDVVYPDVPSREVTGAHRLQHLHSLVAAAAEMVAFAGTPLTQQQRVALCCALDSLLFGEQAP